jgi:coenzyme F420-reducing hydrogenase beta subunit
VIIRTQDGEKVFAGMEERALIETREIRDIAGLHEMANRKKGKGKETKEIFKLKEVGLETNVIAARLGISERRVSHRLEGI